MNKSNASELISAIASLVSADNQFDKIVLTSENKKKGQIMMKLYRGKGKKALRKTYIINLVTNAKMALVGVKSRVPRIKGKAIPNWVGQLSRQPQHVIEAADMNIMLASLGILEVRVLPHNGSTVVGKVVKPKDKK